MQVIYPVPVYTGIVVLNPPEHPDYSRPNPNKPPAPPKTSSTTTPATPNPPAVPTPKPTPTITPRLRARTSFPPISAANHHSQQSSAPHLPSRIRPRPSATIRPPSSSRGGAQTRALQTTRRHPRVEAPKPSTPPKPPAKTDDVKKQ